MVRYIVFKKSAVSEDVVKHELCCFHGSGKFFEGEKMTGFGEMVNNHQKWRGLFEMVQS